uniref:Uncharacterized protein n=1 Tax=Pseudictyota dubia TaxID=2749911 RepID=A0A7R9VM29_9STRA|mmetsp:Transcript_18185/g.33866  ORF Transcript_18185/g.33866 Transcript_18185/m.33866 type:complete len:264 (+) Transcript_18185:72-863(+)
MSDEDAKGIHIRDAISILSSRAAAGGDTGLHDGTEQVSDEHKSMGQTIEAFEWSNEGVAGCNCGTSTPHVDNKDNGPSKSAPVVADGEHLRKDLDKRRKEREVDIRSKLEELSVRSLLGAVFEAQRERTMAYQEYDRGLDTVISTGNITNYPSVCARATASFSVLSDTINTIRAILAEKHGRKDLTKLIGKLQRHEKEKLNTTAALHLERIREKNEVAPDGDERIRQLLKGGVASLRAKVTELINEINEVLEELRYEMAEEEG